MKRYIPWILAALLIAIPAAVLFTSNHPSAPADQARPPGSVPQAASYGVLPDKLAAPTRFVDIADAAGLNYRWTLPGREPRTILQTIGNGCALFDYDNDGNLDILLVGSRLALYKGDGNGHFTDVTHRTGLDKIQGNFLGCAIGDYDNDGYDDIFLTGYKCAALLHNEHGQYFRDVTKEAGIDAQNWSTSAAWADVDNDGRLDLFVCNYVQFGPQDEQLCPRESGILSACGPLVYTPEFGTLYHNDGGGKFSDVTLKAGLDQVSGNDLGAAFADYDRSGHQSIYVANDLRPCNLLVNHGGTFQDIATESATNGYKGQGKYYSGMGVDWGDYDNDGKLDLAVMDFSDEDKMILHNEGNNLFTNQYEDLGLKLNTFPWVSFGVKWLDYDNDGWLDLVMSNGSIFDNIGEVSKTETFRQPTMLFHNDRGAHFDCVSKGLIGNALAPIVGRGLAVGDIDNDGRMDVLVVDSGGKPLLLDNETPDIGHWLDVRLRGTKSNRDGLGALLTADTGTLKQLRLCQTDGSYMSASDRRVHFGLGSARVVKKLIIQWPSGHVDQLTNVPADRVIDVTEGQGR